MEWRGPAQVFHNDVPNAVLEDCFQAEEFRKGSIPTNGFSSLRGISNSSATAVNTCRGKENVNDTCKGGSGLDRGKGTFGDSLPEVGNGVSSSFYSSPSPRVGGRIRFVRDGCISPQNIAKAKQFAENHSDGSIDLQNDRGTSSNSSLNLVRDLIAGGNNVDRTEEPAAKTIDFATSSMHSSHQQGSGRNHHSILILVEVNPVFHSSDSLTSNSYRQSRSPFSQNPSLYGGTNAQGLAYARLTRLRSRVRCELPRISYKGASLEGREVSVVTDYVLKILDLEIRADTLVGDEMQTGEMLVGPSRAL